LGIRKRGDYKQAYYKKWSSHRYLVIAIEINPQSSRLNIKVPIAAVILKYRKALQLGKAVVKHVSIINRRRFDRCMP